MNSCSDHLTARTLTGFKWSSFSTIIQAVLSFLTFIALAHLLTPREFGIVNMATILTNFIERVGFLGIGQALVQREKLTPAHIRCGYFLCLAFGFLFFVFFYFAAPWIAVFYEEPEIVLAVRVISISFLIVCVSEVPLSLLQRDLQFKQLLVITNSSYFLGFSVVGVSLAYAGFNYWALVAATLVSRSLRLILAFRERPQGMSWDFSMKEIRELLSIGVGFSLGRMTNYFALVGDEFVTGKILGAAALGLYSRAYSLMTAPSTYFGQILEKVLFAALAQRQSEPEKIAKYYLFGVEVSALVSVTGAAVLFIAAEEVVLVLFGAKWIGAVEAVRILGIGVFFRTCYKNSDTVIRSLGKVYSLAARQTIYAGVVVIGSIVGSRWGIEGVAVAVLIAVFFNYAVLSYLCMKLLFLPWNSFARAHFPALWLGTWQFLSLSVSLGLCRHEGLSPLFRLVLSGAVMGGTSLLALRYSPRSCTPRVFEWMAKNIPFQRYGWAGRIGRKLLLRHALATT